MLPTRFPDRRWVVGLMLGLIVGAGCIKGGEPESRPVEPDGEAAKGPSSLPVAVTDSGSEAKESAWSLFRGNAQATGVARTELPEKLEQLWVFSVDKGGFEATAAIVDGVVFAGCLDGNLYAIELAHGRRVWELKTPLGFKASAAVRDGRVYVGDSDGKFYCIDAKSGQTKWDFATEAEINSSANFYKDTVLFGSQDGNLYCLSGASGELRWKYAMGDMIQCSPTVAGDRTFVAGCDGRLHVVDLNTGKQVAEVNLEAPTLCTPAVLERMVFVGTTGNAFLGIDWQRPARVWRYSGDRPSEFRSSAAVTPELVIVGARDKLVHALDTKTGQRKWTFTTQGRVDGSPVVAGQRVLFGSADGRLYAADMKSGREVWRFDAGGSIVASPAIAGGRLVIGTEDGELFCLGAK